MRINLAYVRGVARLELESVRALGDAPLELARLCDEVVG